MRTQNAQHSNETQTEATKTYLRVSRVASLTLTCYTPVCTACQLSSTWSKLDTGTNHSSLNFCGVSRNFHTSLGPVRCTATALYTGWFMIITANMVLVDIRIVMYVSNTYRTTCIRWYKGHAYRYYLRYFPESNKVNHSQFKKWRRLAV
jgi:hypothetical protein